jgi:AraC-like DNA-binding protein
MRYNVWARYQTGNLPNWPFKLTFPSLTRRKGHGFQYFGDSFKWAPLFLRIHGAFARICGETQSLPLAGVTSNTYACCTLVERLSWLGTMASRRRIDWSVILRGNAPTATWGGNRAPSDQVELLLAFGDLFKINDRDALLKRTIEIALAFIGLVRAGVYLYDEKLDLMLGSWGTDDRRKIIDEHHSMFQSGFEGRRVFQRALSGEAHWTVVEDCPLIVNNAAETKIIGRGWVVCTPIRSTQGLVGMLYNDAGLTGAAVDTAKQAQTTVLCTVLGLRLEALHGSGKAAYGPSARHPAVASAVRMLTNDPSLGGVAIAKKLGVSLSRFARVFKTDMGLSLVDYRNQLRLDRFLSLVDSGGTNLLEAALAAGFGSYSQFHRVFRALRGTSPREYFVGHSR